jgi:membrane-associated phospholipid phosphatase
MPFTALLLLVQSNWSPLRRIDVSSSVDLHRVAVSHPGFVTTMRTLSTIGTGWTWTAILAIVTGWLVVRRLGRLALFVVVTAVSSSLINIAVKAAVTRARPVSVDPVAVATGFSFPSGHAQSAVVGYGLLAIVFLPLMGRVARRMGVIAAGLMVLSIGFSRIALGVHYITDVLAGYILGLAWLAAMLAVFDLWPLVHGRRPAGGDGLP